MQQNPLVSIVTPSLNSGAFLEQTIQSVLAQDYQPIEYIVMDGGSTDGTLAILERYKHRLHYVSAPDGGAADAINRGFRQSSGAILAWLNADDLYLPGAVSAAVRALLASPEAAAVYGEGYWSDEQGRILDRYPTVVPYEDDMLSKECCICQPACFMRRKAVEAVGLLDSSLNTAFDYDLWIRLSRHSRFMAIPEYLATSRMHPLNKTLAQRDTVFKESMGLLQRNYGYVPLNWIYGYLCYSRDGTDQFYQALPHSASAYWKALVVGSRYNRRHLLRFWKEWLSRIRPRTVARYCAGEPVNRNAGSKT